MSKLLTYTVGTKLLTATDLYETENNATILRLDFTGAGVTSWTKFVRLISSDNQKLHYEFIGSAGTDIVEMSLPSSMMKVGTLSMMPEAYSNGGQDHIIFAIFRRRIERILESGNDAIVDYDVISIVQGRLADLESWELLAKASIIDHALRIEDLEGLIITKSDEGHTHDDRYYTETEIVGLLAGKAPLNHNHDDAYYTIPEMDDLLDAKQNQLTFVAGDNIGLQRVGDTLTISATGSLTLQATLVSLVDAGEHYVATNVETALQEIAVRVDGKASTVHAHDDLYYTEAEVGNLLSTKVDKVTGKSLIADSELTRLTGIETGAEVNNISDANATDLTDGGDTSLHTHDGRYYTESEMATLLAAKEDALTFAEGANIDITRVGDTVTISATGDVAVAASSTTITDAGGYYTGGQVEAALQEVGVSLAGKAPTVHTHDDRYYTEAEMGVLLGNKQATITGAATTIDTEDLTASRVLVSDASGKVATSGITATILGYLSSLAGDIETILGLKAPLASPTFTGAVVLPSTTSIGNVTSTEISYVDGVTSAIQTQFTGKQATITGGATTIATTNLTASRALASNASGKVVVSVVTDAELANLSGLSTNIVTALGGKAPLASPALTGTPTTPTAAATIDTTQVASTAFVHDAIQNDAIDSQGSNANGWWIKYANGIMECWHEFTTAEGTTNVWGSWFMSNPITWTYPIAFLSNNVAFNGTLTGSDLMICAPENVNSTSSTFRLIRGATLAAGTTRVASVRVVGRWK